VKPVMGFMFLALLFAMMIPSEAKAQEPSTQLATKVQAPHEVREAPKVESAGISAEVEALPEVQKALDAEQQAADDAPFVATLDNPFPPDEVFPDEHIVTAAHLEPVPEKPLVIRKMKSQPIKARHIAIFKQPAEKGAKSSTAAAQDVAKGADGICSGKAASTDHVARPCAPKEKP
jgi:hypothetical protein